MAPKKKKSADSLAVLPPPRRSARVRRPPNKAAAANEEEPSNPLVKDSAARDEKKAINGEPLNLAAAQDEVVVHRPKETADVAADDAAAVDTLNATKIAAASDTITASQAGDSEKKITTPTTTITKTQSATTPKTDNATAAADDYDDYDMDSAEDKINAHSSSPKAAKRASIKSQPYVAMPGDDEEDELVAEQPAIKIVKVTADSAKARKSRSKYDNPEEMLTNPRSPLVKARLRDLLCSPKAWDLLTPEERKRVLAKFPDQREILGAGGEDARPDVAALRNNDNFRHDVTMYQDDLAKGKHDPEWIRQAQAAHRRRGRGDYDEYLAARFEEDWGTKMPVVGGYAAEDAGTTNHGEQVEAEAGAAGVVIANGAGAGAGAEEDGKQLSAIDDENSKHAAAGNIQSETVTGEVVGDDQEMTEEARESEGKNLATVEQAEEATAAQDQEMAEVANEAAVGSDSRPDDAHHVDENASTAAVASIAAELQT